MQSMAKPLLKEMPPPPQFFSNAPREGINCALHQSLGRPNLLLASTWVDTHTGWLSLMGSLGCRGKRYLMATYTPPKPKDGYPTAL